VAERSGLTRAVVMAICLGVTALGLNNVYGDNADVMKLAESAACGSGNCAFNVLRQERSPFSQKFGFQVRVTEKGRDRSATADVECKREYVLVGAYTCALTSGGVPKP
jgi:hypothetical protein